MRKTNLNTADPVTDLMLKEVAKTTVLTREEEQSLFQQYKIASNSKKEIIRNKLVQSNLRFVLKIALHYNKILGVDVNDLMSEGKLGLLIAVDKFNPDRGLKFISFAVWHIRCRISKFLEEDDLIRLPPNQKLRLNRLRKMNPDKLDDESKLLMQMMNTPMSLDSPIHDESDLYLRDIIQDETATDGETDWVNSRVRDDLVLIMDEVLSEEERFVIESVFGLNTDGESMTLRETNEAIGKSRERVRQIRDRALAKLKRNVQVQDLHAILNEVNT